MINHNGVEGLINNYNNLVGINTNTDKFSLKEVDCFFKPCAIIFDFFSKGFFNEFLFYVTYHNSFIVNGWWENLFNAEKYPCAPFFKLYAQELFNKFKISIKEQIITNEEDFHTSIRRELDKGSPILVPGDLFYLFYSDHYKKYHSGHYFIIKGYDANRRVYKILDNIHYSSNEVPTYVDFSMQFETLYKMMCQYFYNFYPDVTNRYFWTFTSTDNVGKPNFTEVINKHYDHFKLLETGENTIKYIEQEGIDYIFKNGIKSKEDLDEKIFRMLKRVNSKTAYYTILLNYLSSLNIAQDKIEKLDSVKFSTLHSWEQLVNKFMYSTIKYNYDLSKVRSSLNYDKLLDDCIRLEIEFRTLFVNMVNNIV